MTSDRVSVSSPTASKKHVLGSIGILTSSLHVPSLWALPSTTAAVAHFSRRDTAALLPQTRKSSGQSCFLFSSFARNTLKSAGFHVAGPSTFLLPGRQQYTSMGYATTKSLLGFDGIGMIWIGGENKISFSRHVIQHLYTNFSERWRKILKVWKSTLPSWIKKLSYGPPGLDHPPSENEAL